MLPIFYVSEEGSISPELANDFKSAVYTVKYGVTGGIWAAIGLAGQTHFNLATIKSPLPFCMLTLGKTARILFVGL
jgi:hypothetical protein